MQRPFLIAVPSQSVPDLPPQVVPVSADLGVLEGRDNVPLSTLHRARKRLAVSSNPRGQEELL